MNKFSLILIFVFFLVTSNLANGADLFKEDNSKKVRIIVNKAIIYADDGLKNPIGFISNGKSLTVGTPLKKNNEILPTIISGRLAFIEAKDVASDDNEKTVSVLKRGAPKEHNVNILIDTPEEKLSENNSAYFSLHTYSGGPELEQLFERIDSQSKSNILGYSISLLHRKENSRILYGANYEYNFISSGALKVDYFLLSFLAGYTPIKNPLFLIDIIGSYDFSIGAEIKVENNSINEPAAFLHGPSIKAQLVMFPYKKYHLVGTLGYHSYSFTKPDELHDQNDVAIATLTKIQGLFIGIGMGIEFF